MPHSPGFLTRAICGMATEGKTTTGREYLRVSMDRSAQVKIHVTTHNRTYDPSNGRDRRSLLEDAVDSEYESGKISARLKRAAAANAAPGKPHGRARTATAGATTSGQRS
jgi:site-specific DNA recombinase